MFVHSHSVTGPVWQRTTE